jgi:hypothetical protein
VRATVPNHSLTPARNRTVSRWKAAALHLVVSGAVVAGVAFVLIQLWYGWPMFQVMGGAKLLTILAIVDVVIGPLLTLIVFKRGKPSLKFDLVVIFVLQAAFLGYGLYVMAQSRPVFLVGLVDRFEFVRANDLSPENLALGTTPEYRTLSWTGPRLVGGALGRTRDERYRLGMLGLSGQDIHQLPERYVPYAEVEEALLKKVEPAAALASTSDAAARAIGDFAQSHRIDIQELGTLPITSRQGRATMMIRVGTGEILGPIALEPWPDLAPVSDAERH